MDCDWPWWIMFSAAMVSSYFKEMLLRKERNDPRCTLFCTYHPLLYPAGQLCSDTAKGQCTADSEQRSATTSSGRSQQHRYNGAGDIVPWCTCAINTEAGDQRPYDAK